jgi:hypothetical protein
MQNKVTIDFEQFQKQQDFYAWREHLLYKYPHAMIMSGYRIPDREGEVDSFQNWIDNGRPVPSLFNYGELIKDEPSNGFVEMIMSK